MAGTLTDTKIRKAKPGERDYKLADGDGLHLLIRRNGSKLWRYRYRFGTEKMLALGRYPDVGLADAREARDEARKLVGRGEDPVQYKRLKGSIAKQNASETFREVALAWFALGERRWAAGHAKRVKRSLEKDVFPYIGTLPIGKIDAPTILDVLRKVENRGTVETAKRMRQRIDAVFVYAKSLGQVRDNPASDLDKVMQRKPRVKPRPAITDVAQLRELLDKTEQSGAYPLTLLGSRLLALTAVRPGNIRSARWADFHNIEWESAEPAPSAIWHIGAEQMKLSMDRKADAGFDHIVPLVPAAVDVLRASWRLSGRCDLVFPSQWHTHKPLSENTINLLYKRCGYEGQHVAHGWRAAFSTIMNEWAKREGEPDDRAVIDLMLAHVPENKVEAAYNRAEFMPRRRELAERWAAMLMEGARPADDLLSLARRVGRG